MGVSLRIAQLVYNATVTVTTGTPGSKEKKHV
jgi:hypothetical protein